MDNYETQLTNAQAHSLSIMGRSSYHQVGNRWKNCHGHDPLLFEKYVITSKLVLKLCGTISTIWLLVFDNDSSVEAKEDNRDHPLHLGQCNCYVLIHILPVLHRVYIHSIWCITDQVSDDQKSINKPFTHALDGGWRYLKVYGCLSVTLYFSCECLAKSTWRNST